MPCPDADHLTSILNELYEDRGKLEATAELCYLRATDPQFHWKNIASQFGGVFQDTLNGISHSVIEEELKKIEKKLTATNRKVVSLDKRVSTVESVVNVTKKRIKYKVDTDQVQCTTTSADILIQTICDQIANGAQTITINKC